MKQASKRAARPGEPTRPNRLFFRAGRAKFFVGPARPDVFIVFSLFFIIFYASH
jgi:hypothetical protein